MFFRSSTRPRSNPSFDGSVARCDCSRRDVIVLDRSGPSELQITIGHYGKTIAVTFHLTAWIDMDVRGFNHQNVLGGLKLRRAGDRDVQAWEAGVGLESGDFILELEPCFGAYGLIRASIASVAMDVLSMA